VQWELLTKNIGLALNPESIKQTSSPISSNASLPSSDNLVSTVVRGELTSKSGFGAVMQALSSQGKISVLSSPRVSALNNQRALIKFGDDKFFVTNVTNTSLSNSNNNSGAVSGFDLEPFFSGIALDATPNIVNDREVVMHIHPMISRVEEEIKRIKIDNKDTSIPIATIQTREADTVVKAHSGDIIILGGMMQNLVNLNDSNIPFANLGFLSKILKPFLSSQRSSKRQELIILLKPTIIHTTKKSSEISFDKYLIP
jgi:MSHA biogenesis protein MshL